jgi:hypothetical protein
MGYQNLYLVPSDPEFVPSQPALKESADLIDRWQDEYLYSFEGPAWMRVSAHPKLHGSFPDEIVCPKCNTKLDISGDEELDEWQYEAQSAFHSSENQRSHVFHMPCCGADVVASDLGLDLPTRWSKAYYARFAVELSELGDCDQLEAAHLKALEELLGCNLISFIESGT